MAFQLKTFQGVRFALFHYNTNGARGGVADFDLMRVDEPNPRGLMQPIPFGRTIALRAAGRDTPFAIDGERRFTVVDRGLGRVALRAGNRFLTVTPLSDSTSMLSLRAGTPSSGETFQWMETLYGDLMLMSLETHRYLRLEPDGRVSSDSRGAEPDPNDGTALRWRRVATDP
jgi:xylan 1,4-beta-xylosidase